MVVVIAAWFEAYVRCEVLRSQRIQGLARTLEEVLVDRLAVRLGDQHGCRFR